MQEIRLFNYGNNSEIESDDTYPDNESRIAIKGNPQVYLNIKAVKYNFKTPPGIKIDILALDSTLTPVMVVFQRSHNESIIEKGILCLDWILTGRVIFHQYIIKRFPGTPIEKIKWEDAKLICVSKGYSEKDIKTAFLTGRNIELIIYKKYPGDLLLIKKINASEIYNFHESKQNKVVDINLRDESRYKIKNDKICDKKTYINEDFLLKIGYCSIKNNIHYVIFPDGSTIRITEIPEATYLAEGQFVLVNENGRFCYAYRYQVDADVITQAVHCYALAYKNDQNILIDKGDGKLCDLYDIPAGVDIRNKVVVAVDSKNSFIRYFKPIKRNADNFMASVKAKGHQMVFVIKTNENSLFVRDIESGKEFDCLIKQGRTVEEKSVICVFGDKITAILGSVRFYTSSSYYDNYKFGSVEIKDDLVFLKELTGEQVEIMHTPKNLQPGQVIYVDEYYNFCGVYKHYDNFNKNIEPKNTVNIRPYKRKNKAEKIDIFKNVLILGNNSFEKSYKSGFLKFGYKAEVLEGYEAWPKINSRIKDTDIIVIITDHISHNNMWRVKEYVTDIPVVYSEFNGVNRILQQIIDMEQKEYIPVDTNLI